MRLHLLTALCAIAFVDYAGASTQSLVVDFTFDAHASNPTNYQGSFFYLNDSIENGHVLAGQIGFGAYAVDGTGAVTQVLQTNQILNRGWAGDSIGNPPIGAKSVVRLGDYYYLGGNNYAGIARFDATGPSAWAAGSLTPLVNITGGIESVTTDGTLLFTNEADPAGGGRHIVHAFSVTNQAGSFSLSEVWQTPLTPGGRIRGLAYGGNGYLYAADNGSGGAGTLWAISAATGAATALTTYADPRSPGNSFLGEPFATFGAIVRDVPDPLVDELLVIGTGGVLSAFDLATPTTLVFDGGTGQPLRRDFDLQQLLSAAGKLPSADAGVAGYGLAYDEASHLLWLSYEAQGEATDPNHFSRRMAGFTLNNPEPGTLALAALGGVLLLRRRR